MTNDNEEPSAASAGSLPLDQIICGDNCEVMRTLPSESIDLVVTSPPYDDLRTYGGHRWSIEETIEQIARLLKLGGSCVWVVSDATKNGSETGASIKQAALFMEAGLLLHDTMIWEKTGSGCMGSPYCYAQNWEYMFVFSKGRISVANMIHDRENVVKSGTVKVNGVNGGIRKDGTFDTKTIERKPFGKRTNVWRMAPAQKTGHPAAFPTALARDHILSWSNPGDVVLDPFSGSGTTAKMARETGRRFIGIEVNPEYVEISRKRLAQQVLPIGAAS